MSVLLNLWQISILYHLLDKVEFSIWVTIISLTNWILLFDVGVGNSLRNKVSLLIHTNREIISSYVTNAYILTFGILIILVLVNIFFFLFVDWNLFFNTYQISAGILGWTIFITVFAVSVNQFFSLISQLFHSLRRSELASVHSVTLNLLFCVQIYFGHKYIDNLYYLSLAYITSIIISGVGVTVTFYLKYRDFRPSINKINFSMVYELANIGFVLLFIEIAPLILNFSNNIFITKYVGIQYVGNFNIVFRIFFSVTTTSWLIIVPFWAFTSECMSKGDFQAIRHRIKNLKLIIIPLILFLITISYFFDDIVRIWIGKAIHFDHKLLFFLSIFVVLSYWNTIYIFLFNGLNIYKYNVLYPISIIILAWPLSYFFCVINNMGVVGVIQSSIISMLPYSIYSYILSKTKLKI
ncbi:MAG: hypothetical protein V4585_13505 [Bacteroidota bacterium]